MRHAVVALLCGLVAISCTSPPSQSAPPTELGGIRQPALVDAYAGLNLEAAIASDACALWLVGEQIEPTDAGIVVHTLDCGVNSSRFVLPNALHVRAVEFGGDGIFVGGESNAGAAFIATSADGRSWRSIDLPESRSVDSMAIDGAALVIAGRTAKGAVVWRWDGVSVSTLFGPSPDLTLNDVIVVGDRIEAVGTRLDNGVVVTGKSGSPFEIAEIEGTSNLSAIELAGDKLVAVGSQFSSAQPELKTGVVAWIDQATLSSAAATPTGALDVLDVAVDDTRTTWVIVSTDSGTVLETAPDSNGPWSIASRPPADDRGIARFVAGFRPPEGLLIGAGLFAFDH